MPRNKRKPKGDKVGKHGTIPIDASAEASAALTILKRAVYNGWEIHPEIIESIPKLAALIIANGESDRDKLRAMEVLQRLVRDRWEAAIELDRIQRLERGEATERVEIGTTITQEQLNAVADFLDGGHDRTGG